MPSVICITLCSAPVVRLTPSAWLDAVSCIAAVHSPRAAARYWPLECNSPQAIRHDEPVGMLRVTAYDHRLARHVVDGEEHDISSAKRKAGPQRAGRPLAIKESLRSPSWENPSATCI